MAVYSIYTTQYGDSWDLISYRVYGNEYFLHYIMQANPEWLDTYIFDSGVQLIIPDLYFEESGEGSLPPWKLE